MSFINVSFYSVANYYQYNAAVAGSLSTANFTSGTIADTTDSICPKGWELPISRRNLDSVSPDFGLPIDQNKNFYNLFAAYGYTIDQYQKTHNVSYANVLSGQYQNPLLTPFYATITGTVEHNNQRIGYSFYGFLWSKSAIGPDAGMNALITPALYLVNNSGIGTGFPIRCVTK